VQRKLVFIISRLSLVSHL